MKRTLLALAAVILMAGTASANDRAGAMSLSPFIGGYTYDGVQNLQTRPVYGLRLGYDFTDNMAAEAVFHYVATEGTEPKQDLESYSYRLDLLYNLMPRTMMVPFVPFVAVGGGATTIDYETNRKDTTSATFNYGLGAKYFMTPSMALRTDLRHLLIFKGDPAGRSTINNYEYTIGVTFLFGGPAGGTTGGYR